MDISLDFLLRSFTVCLLLVWWFYWTVTERIADREKPKTKIEKSVAMRQQIRRWVLRIAEGIMVLQVLAVQILPFNSFYIQIVGFILVIIGVVLSISARKTLGTNWAHAYEYQVKTKQELVTSGVYSLIRHPIYFGLCLAFIGGELVAQSYLVFIGVALLIGGFIQARQEEAILSEYFGNEYKTYIKHTKMFIPFLW